MQKSFVEAKQNFRNADLSTTIGKTGSEYSRYNCRVYQGCLEICGFLGVYANGEKK